MKAKRIFEKFKEDSDPISDMEIGRNIHRNFENRNELMKWLFDKLTLILETNSIPNDIINANEHILFPWEYWDTINDYMKEYITFKGKVTEFTGYDMTLQAKLKELGYPK